MSNVSESLRGIFDAHKKLTPTLVVQAAAPPDSPLHEHFTWDDTEAAWQWRLEEARRLIRSVRIQREGADETVREFIRLVRHIPDADDDTNESYLPTEQVAENVFLKAAFLRQMEADWRAFRRKYQAYKEFWDLIGGTGGDGTGEQDTG